MNYTQPLLMTFLVLALAGLVLGHRRGASKLRAVGLIGLLLQSLPLVDWVCALPLEARYPVQRFRSERGQAIVVLSSAAYPPNVARPYYSPDRDTYERCEFGAWLYHNWKAVPVLACGGAGKPGTRPLSLVMRDLLVQQGVPAEQIWTETESKNTYENALYGSRLLREHGVLDAALVVEAQSMLRAEACFRKQGIEIEPAPCRFRGFRAAAREILPNWSAIERNEITAHEMLGLAWYRYKGWI